MQGNSKMLMYKAVLEREAQFDGRFFAGVKTTKIYCLPSCKAKKPKLENLVFFQTREEAEGCGFRSCKICFPALPVGKWVDQGHSVSLFVTKDFNFDECLKFLSRSSNECLHYIEKNQIYKTIRVNNRYILLRISKGAVNSINIEFLNACQHKPTRIAAAEFVCEWLDLFSDLTSLYELAEKDVILNNLVHGYKGLRLIGIPDLFEALTWAIIGQQINLSFAYTLKKRFVTRFGDKLVYANKEYWIFPEAEQIAALTVNDLIDVGLTRRKSGYILELSNEIKLGSISKKDLSKHNGFETAYKKLSALRGVGDWTANYVLMKCLRYPSAFPIGDAGLQNAIKQQLKLNQKPTTEEILKLSSGWKGWEAYATFYLWRSLIP
jgi:DNA-3-methyladenine glycosylase II